MVVFAVSCWYWLLVALVCCCLLLFAAVCCCLLLFVAVCCYLLLSAGTDALEKQAKQAKHTSCYLLLFASFCCCLLLFAAVCCSLLLFAGICCQLLLLAGICCQLQVSVALLPVAASCWYLLSVAGFCCSLLLVSAVCSNLLPCGSQHDPKMVEKDSQASQNRPRESQDVPKCPPGDSKRSPGRVKIRPRSVPGCLRDPCGQQVAIMSPSLSIWRPKIDAIRDPKIDQKSSFCDNGCSKERCFIDLCGKCSFSRFFGGFLVDFSRKIDEKTDVFFHNLACFFQTGDLHETLYFTMRKLLFRVFRF